MKERKSRTLNKKCGILLCGRPAKRYILSSNSSVRYMCESCYRAYILGKQRAYTTISKNQKKQK